MMNDDYYLLRELVLRLPASAEWTTEHRDTWLKAMESTVDLVMLGRRREQREEKRVTLPVFWNFVRGE